MTAESVKSRENEKGAALVMALMVTFLLLVGVTGLLMESTKNTQNVTDAIAEQEAYYAAESGIQTAVNVLRYKCTAAVSPCKVAPSPLLNTAVADYNKANTINYSRALALSTSNLPDDTSLVPRLSRWISYDATAADRVKLGDPGTPYVSRTGHAYSVEMSDPDNTGSNISFSTTGSLFDHDTGNLLLRTYGSGANRVEIRYKPAPVTTVFASGTTLASTSLGSFTYQVFGTGAPILALNRFEIVVRMTIPFAATRVVRGFIEPIASPSSSNRPKIIFDSQTYDLRGSDLTLNVPGATMTAPGSTPYGYEATMVASSSSTDPGNVVGATISATLPGRLLIKSTGYGPRGAQKQLEALIQNNYFNGLGAPATITMVGPASTTNPATNFTFDPGNSNAMLYSGQDAAGGSTDLVPPIGVTSIPDPATGDDSNLDDVLDAVGGQLSNNLVGVPSNVRSELPPWLTSPLATDGAVKAIYNVALNSADPVNPTGRYFPDGSSPSTWGDYATGTGVTFCDGNCTFGPGNGGGILVVTGTLTLNGNFGFNGLIIVTGQGGVIRSGGGNGTIQGNLVICPYVASSIFGSVDPASGAGFLAPQYSTSGGGNSTITYNSNNQLSGLSAVSNIVLGVVEK